MLTRGSSQHTKGSFAEEIEGMGARLDADHSRERQALTVRCFKGDVSRAVQLLGDCVSNATLDPAELELVKSEVADEHEKNHTDYERTTLEQVQYNAFREHQIGQPSRGDPDQLQNLTSEILDNYRAANFFGDNIVVVGTGGIDHDSFVDQVNQAFSSIGQTSSVERPNGEKPIYVPALLMIRDDEMINANVGVFYDAPSYKDPDYFSFCLLKAMFGQYRIDVNAGNLNDAQKQYNAFHTLVSDLPDVTLANSHYFAGPDYGLWGNYLFGNEVFVRQMNYCGVSVPTIYSHYVNDVEVIRARNYLYNHLMQRSNDTKASGDVIGRNMLGLGRNITRSEIAARLSNMDAYHIKHLCNQWFYDAEPSFTNWGAIENTASIGSYKYFKVNTMSTVFNSHHSLFT